MIVNGETKMENQCLGCIDYHFEKDTGLAWCSHLDCVEEHIDDCALYHCADDYVAKIVGKHWWSDHFGKLANPTISN